MESKLTYYINDWDLEADSHEFQELGFTIEHLGNKLFKDYEPSIGPKPDFFQRLDKWIDNVEDPEDKKILAQLVPKIFYVGLREMETLYQVAFDTAIVKWIINEKKIRISETFDTDINQAISETWFCPITDSMRINQFYHLNGIINNADIRPEWQSLAEFGSVAKIKSYLKRNNLKRIVLLEDFVGSGNQIKKTLEFATENFEDYSILVIPIIMCPHAEENLDAIIMAYSNIELTPVLLLNRETFVSKEYNDNTDQLFRGLHQISKNEHHRMREGGLKSPFLGFRNIGATIVLYSNTPNNTIPLIWSNNNWNPLFNRSRRN